MKNVRYIEDYIQGPQNKDALEDIKQDVSLPSGKPKDFQFDLEMVNDKLDILVSKRKRKVDVKRSVALLLSSLFCGSSISFLVMSLFGEIIIPWEFFGAMSFASGGLAIASFQILVGVDGKRYE